MTGRNNTRRSDIITQIVTEAFIAGFNPKSIAGYFGWKYFSTVHKRLLKGNAPRNLYYNLGARVDRMDDRLKIAEQKRLFREV